MHSGQTLQAQARDIHVALRTSPVLDQACWDPASELRQKTDASRARGRPNPSLDGLLLRRSARAECVSRAHDPSVPGVCPKRVLSALLVCVCVCLWVACMLTWGPCSSWPRPPTNGISRDATPDTRPALRPLQRSAEQTPQTRPKDVVLDLRRSPGYAASRDAVCDLLQQLLASSSRGARNA